VGSQIKAGIQKNSTALPVLSPFKAKSFLGCQPMVLHEKIEKKNHWLQMCSQMKR
jgi:hypothetical protein